MYRLRAATAADIDFLTDVVIEATRDQGRLPPDFDEAEYRAGFAEWTAEQIAEHDGASGTRRMTNSSSVWPVAVKPSRS